MPATTAAVRRVPGIRFEAQPLLPEPDLPRMDVAGFVGFAATGPVDIPVAVADIAQFSEVFGEAPSLFWDPATGEPTRAHLAPAVRAFFRNGGTRCWVVRVTGRQPGKPGLVSAAWRARFPVCGLARPGDYGLPEQADFAARAAGSWADDVAVSAGLLSTRLVLAGEPQWDAATATVTCALRGPARLTPGDLVRVTYRRTGVQLLFVVSSLPSAPGALTGTAALWLAPWAPGSGASVPATAQLAGGVEATIRADGENGAVRVGLPDAELAPPAGTLLRLDAEDARLLLIVERAFGADLSGRLVRPSPAPPEEPSPPGAAGPAEVLTFELRARLAEERLFALGSLGFHPDHPRYAGALPTDEELYAAAPTPDDPAARPRPVLWQDADLPRFPLAGIADGPVLYPVGMEMATGWPFLRAWPDPGRALERDGLGAFDAGIFLDPAMAGAGTDTALETADFLRYRSENPRSLVGIHALLGVDEVTLAAVPDAVHRPWLPAKPAPLAAPPAREAFAQPAQCGHGGPGFEDCTIPSLPPPTWDSTQADRHGNVHLTWNAVGQAEEYLVDESADERSWRGARQVYRGPSTSLDLYGLPPGGYFYRLRALAGDASSDWSDGIAVMVSAGEPWITDPGPDSTLLAIHRSLVRMCAARGDMLAVLSVPRNYRERDVVAHTALVRGPEPTPGHGAAAAVLPIGGEERTLSFAAVYHPWPVTADDQASRIAPIPPDGAASGILAKRALLRGPWIAPANETLTDVVALEPAFAAGTYQQLQDGRVNTVRHEPRGFLWLSADTLSDDPDLRPVSVRRLMSLLRRVVLRDGPSYVFEPNDEALRRNLQRRFETTLSQLLVRGAFAGTTADETYQVVIGGPPNTAQSLSQGRLIVELKVAPSIPMRYLTIRLVDTGGQVVAMEGA